MTAFVSLIGRLGADSELRYFESGSVVLNFRVATNRYDSNLKEKVADWYSVSLFGKRAENLVEILKKGSQVFVSGELAMIEKDEKLYPTIKTNNIELCGKKES